MELVGHLIGAIAIVLFFLSYQMREKKKLLVVQSAATALMSLQYLLIGAYSGFVLNAVCLVRNAVFYYRDKKGTSNLAVSIVFALVMAGTSLFSWDGYHSLFIITALMMNTVCLGICNAQSLRKSVLVTCPLVIVYNGFERSYSGLISESISLLSAIIGIIHYRRSDKTAE